MYFPDLSPYTYWDDEADRNTLNVGWLDDAHPYPTGAVSDTFLDALWPYCTGFIRLTFGFHTCPFCHEDIGVEVIRHGERATLGSAEIRVIGIGEMSYAAPDMIYHYIVDHGYLPPKDFIQAVLESPFPPTSPDYQNRYGHM